MNDTEEDRNAIEDYIQHKRTYPFYKFPNYRIYNNPHRRRHILSFGIIPYCRSTRKFLMIQRRYSPNYLTMLRGSYRRSNLPRLIRGMCHSELCMIRRVVYRQINMFELLSIVVPNTDHDYSAMRFENHESDILQLINLYQSTNHTRDDPEWLFPKGKPERQEDGFNAASREFEEETGIDSSRLVILSSSPIISYYQADNDFIYETQYWTTVFSRTPDMPDRFQSYEVMARKWFDQSEISTFARTHQLTVLQEATVQINKYDTKE